MKIGGWKTRSVFERYAIVSQSDIRDAMTALQAGQQREKAKAAREEKAEQKQFGHNRTQTVWVEGKSLPMIPPVN